MDYQITRASFNLTRACNLACPFCFTNGCTKGSMPLAIATKAVDFLFKNAKECQGKERQVEISYWGGEPLIEWELMKQVTLYAKNVSKETAIPVRFGGTTNGTLLTPEKFDFLNEHKILFLISIDGKKESHDLFRKFKDGRGSHDIVIRNAEAALKRWPIHRARLSLSADRIDHFCEDMSYLFDLGFNYIMFSPIYEGNWTEEKWQIFEKESIDLIDYMGMLKAKGRSVVIEHFRSYCRSDNSPYPCGAGRSYAGIDIDGAIYPCHRFNKFDDNRDWHDKEVCIGHVEHGITRPEFRDQFINFKPEGCNSCERSKDTPCHGGCYAVNYDFTKDIRKAFPGMCKYVESQKKVSNYYGQKFPAVPMQNSHPCICYNQCYLQNTENQIMMLDKSGMQCQCYQTKYNEEERGLELAQSVRFTLERGKNAITKQNESQKVVE